MNWVYDLPTWQFSILLTSIALCLTCGSHILMRRFVARDLLLRHNDVAGFVASLVGVIYAVLLSFVVIVVWQEYDAATSIAQKEANAVADLYHLSYGMPDPLAAHIRGDLSNYINVMVRKEWPLMQHGESSHEADLVGHHILSHIIHFNPTSLAQAQIRDSGLKQVQVFFDARRDRLSANETSLPRILWMTLVIGALVTIGFTFFFGMESARLQVTMTAGLTLVIVAMFVLIIELDYPFRGDTRVQPEMWHDLQREMGSALPEDVYRP
ncbi:MAG: DUF4239 domain-containing protein [Candidatus Eremiobacteraeota bacterium]|nr:DUF4239 domain-containing protein [Candidatus Eremiobacteraeota bacterium]